MRTIPLLHLPPPFTDSEVALMTKLVKGIIADKPFRGVFLHWRLLDYSRVLMYPQIEKPYLGETALKIMGVLPFDLSREFELYRPIITTYLVGLDLRNMLVESSNSTYQLRGPVKRVLFKAGRYDLRFEKERREVSNLARDYRLSLLPWDYQ